MKVLYDNFEVSLVGEFDEGRGTFCERLDVYSEEEQSILKEEAIATFWTVYGHKPDGTVDAIGDFNNEEYANQLCDFFNHLLDESGYRNNGFEPVQGE